MPVTPADLRDLLRADAVGLVLGLLLMLTALATLVLGSVLRRQSRFIALAGRLRSSLRLPAPGTR